MKRMSRVLTLVLALALCFACMAVPVFADDEQSEQCICSEDICYGNCPLCQDGDWRLANCPLFLAYPDMCICDEWCNGTNQQCGYCSKYGGCAGKGPDGVCICTEHVCYMYSCSLCADKEWRLANCPEWQAYPQTPPSSSTPCSEPSSNKKSGPDVSGKYRTSLTKIMATVSPVAVATALEDDQLVIDPVTNTVGNLYDSEGNLITCTLSSDGHFIIVPTNDGYAYIPTGK